MRAAIFGTLISLLVTGFFVSAPVAGFYSPRLVPRAFLGKNCQYVLYTYSDEAEKGPIRTAFILASDIELLSSSPGPDGELTGTFPGPDNPARTLFLANLKVRNPFHALPGRNTNCDLHALKRDQALPGFPKDILPLTVIGATIRLDRLYGVEVTSASASHARALYPGNLRAKFLLSEKESSLIAQGAQKQPTRIEVRYEVRINRPGGISIQMLDPIIVEATI